MNIIQKSAKQIGLKAVRENKNSNSKKQGNQDAKNRRDRRAKHVPND